MRVDGQALAAEPELNQAQVRVVTAFAVKLTVDADLVRVTQSLDNLGESSVRSDVG